MNNYVVLRNEQDQQKLLSWWRSLNGHSEDGNEGSGHRAWRAELRRAENPEDVLLSKAFRSLYLEMVDTSWAKNEYLLALSAVAGILSHISEHKPTQSFAETCARPLEGKQKSPVSELRFSQLQKSKTLDELFQRMRRVLQLIDRKANVLSVADSILHWYKEMVNGKPEAEPRNRIRVHWGLEYFQNMQGNQVQEKAKK